MMEEVARIGEAGGLVGILSRPDAGATSRVGALLLDVGLTYRVGPSRLYVRIARALAARGVPAVRFDFSGVGDSPSRRDVLPFSESGPLETTSVMTWLGRETGVDRFVLIGLCSGARVAFQTALRDERVAGIGLLNLRNLQEEENSDLRGVAESYDTLRALTSWSRWRRALGGKSDYKSVLRSLGRALGKISDRHTAGGEARAVPGQFRTLLDRGTHVGLFFSEEEFGRRYLRLVLGSEHDALVNGPGVSEQIIPRTDHTFTSAESQRLLLEGLVEWTVGVRSSL